MFEFTVDEELYDCAGLRVLRAHDSEGEDFLLKTFDATGVPKIYVDKFKSDTAFFVACKDMNITSILDVVIEGSVTTIVYRYPAGGDLETLLQTRGDIFADSFVKSLCETVLHALSFIHENGVVHNAILPRNITFSKSSSTPGWLENIQLSSAHCSISIKQTIYDDFKQLAFLLCLLIKRNLPTFLFSSFTPVVLKSTKWDHLTAEFIDFIEQMWVAENNDTDIEVFVTETLLAFQVLVFNTLCL